MAMQAGFDEAGTYEAALETARQYVAAREMAEDRQARERAELLAEIQKRHRLGKPMDTAETIIQWWLRLEKYIEGQPMLFETVGVVATFVVNAQQLVLQTAVRLLDALLGALMALKEKHDVSALGVVMTFTVEAADILAARLRVKPKVVWAPLYRRQGKPLTRAEQLNLEIAGPTEDAKGYAADLEDTIALLEKHYGGEDDMPELLRNYIRPVYRPSTAYGTEAEFEGVANAPTLLDPEGVLDKRVASYLARGVKRTGRCVAL
jgi:hypothetical protein